MVIERNIKNTTLVYLMKNKNTNTNLTLDMFTKILKSKRFNCVYNSKFLF